MNVIKAAILILATIAVVWTISKVAGSSGFNPGDVGGIILVLVVMLVAIVADGDFIPGSHTTNNTTIINNPDNQNSAAWNKYYADLAIWEAHQSAQREVEHKNEIAGMYEREISRLERQNGLLVLLANRLVDEIGEQRRDQILQLREAGARMDFTYYGKPVALLPNSDKYVSLQPVEADFWSVLDNGVLPESRRLT